MTLKAMRDARGLTQAELASRTGLSQTAISALERGLHSNPGVDTLGAISTALGCSLDEVILALRESVSEAA